MNRPKVLVKLSVYNEARNLAAVLKAMPAYVDLLVVDDGSEDDTALIAVRHGAKVIRHPVNLGQGAADITGFQYAFRRNYDSIVEMDGDGQHDPRDIPAFLKALDESGADIVTGSRVLGSNHPANSRLRRFFLPHFTRLVNHLTDFRLTDALCGFKAYRAKKLKEHADVLEKVLEPQYIASELYIRLARRGFTVAEIPIHIDLRDSGMSTKGNFRYGIKILKSIFRTWIMGKTGGFTLKTPQGDLS